MLLSGGVQYLGYISTTMGLLGSAVAHVRNTIPFLRPLRELIIGFTITGWLIYRIPISGEYVVCVWFNFYTLLFSFLSLDEAKAKSRKLCANSSMYWLLNRVLAWSLGHSVFSIGPLTSYHSPTTTLFSLLHAEYLHPRHWVADKVDGVLTQYSIVIAVINQCVNCLVLLYIRSVQSLEWRQVTLFCWSDVYVMQMLFKFHLAKLTVD